jgi:putative FmdB family regulatory protein
MPTYEYQCPGGHAFDKIQKISEKPRAKCPVCGKAAVRKISGGAGLLFKGSGFYITDYGKDGKGPRKPESESAAAPEPKASDAKPAGGKQDSTPAPKADSPAAKPSSRQGKGKASSE